MTKQLTIKFMQEPKRYSEEDLLMFKNLIINKLELAKQAYQEQKDIMTSSKENSTDDTSWSFKADDGPQYASKEEATILAKKQEVYIISLKNALDRIENKTYGICFKTGELISKERLMAVPNTTLSLLIKNQNS